MNVDASKAFLACRDRHREIPLEGKRHTEGSCHRVYVGCQGDETVCVRVMWKCEEKVNIEEWSIGQWGWTAG